MIRYVQGDILDADIEALVNTVNTVGVMGRGIALQFKRAYPKNFKAYEAACKRGDVQVGQMFVFERGELTNPRYIINFPTKKHWRAKSRIEDIQSGLEALVDEIKALEIASIAIPPLGAGSAGSAGRRFDLSSRARWRSCRTSTSPYTSPSGRPRLRRCRRRNRR